MGHHCELALVISMAGEELHVDDLVLVNIGGREGAWMIWHWSTSVVGERLDDLVFVNISGGLDDLVFVNISVGGGGGMIWYLDDLVLDSV